MLLDCLGLPEFNEVNNIIGVDKKLLMKKEIEKIVVKYAKEPFTQKLRDDMAQEIKAVANKYEYVQFRRLSEESQEHLSWYAVRHKCHMAWQKCNRCFDKCIQADSFQQSDFADAE